MTNDFGKSSWTCLKHAITNVISAFCSGFVFASISFALFFCYGCIQIQWHSQYSRKKWNILFKSENFFIIFETPHHISIEILPFFLSSNSKKGFWSIFSQMLNEFRATEKGIGINLHTLSLKYINWSFNGLPLTMVFDSTNNAIESVICLHLSHPYTQCSLLMKCALPKGF